MARRRMTLMIITVGIALAGLSLGLTSAQSKSEGGFAGFETCATCHEDAAKAFRDGAHGAAMAARSPEILKKACESCHGPGAAHADDPQKTNITRIPKPEACLSCHPNSQSLMARNLPGHVRNGLACLDCHTPGHSAPPAQPLLAAEPSVLCAKCHGDVAASFKMPYTHRKGDKGFDCTACHTAHGENRTGRLLEYGVSGACTECHLDKGGPYVFPHPPRNVNGCVQCHKPHGSPNPKMLVRYRVFDLCLECHTDIPGFHDVTKPRYQNCVNCHVGIHGSNHDPNLKDD